MTAEIAILNRGAIALAADSAVTVDRSDTQSFYNSAIKLFMLSKYNPIGIMIYQDANIMNLPWETAIKIYRRKLGKNTFKTMEEYGDDFLSFLASDLFTQSEQDAHFEKVVGREFRIIRKHAKSAAEEAKLDKPTTEILDQTIESRHSQLRKLPLLDGFATKFVDILGKYRTVIDSVREEIFKDYQLSQHAIATLSEIVPQIFNRDRFFERTGVVIAGFGDDDKYPSYVNYHIDSVVLNTLKYKAMSRHSVEKQGACIAPFAQDIEVEAFITGVHPGATEYMLKSLQELLTRYLENRPTKVSDDIKIKSDASQEDAQVIKSIIHDYGNLMEQYKHDSHISPILSTIEVLPKDELAVMAEALVNLTSFKKRVRMETPTVGGPIDVAVISKGDGFIWMKRKHYFKTELNPHFLNNYFQDKSQVNSKVI